MPPSTNLLENVSGYCYMDFIVLLLSFKFPFLVADVGNVHSLAP